MLCCVFTSCTKKGSNNQTERQGQFNNVQNENVLTSTATVGDSTTNNTSNNIPFVNKNQRFSLTKFTKEDSKYTLYFINMSTNETKVIMVIAKNSYNFFNDSDRTLLFTTVDGMNVYICVSTDDYIGIYSGEQNNDFNPTLHGKEFLIWPLAKFTGSKRPILLAEGGELV